MSLPDPSKQGPPSKQSICYTSFHKVAPDCVTSRGLCTPVIGPLPCLRSVAPFLVRVSIAASPFGFFRVVAGSTAATPAIPGNWRRAAPCSPVPAKRAGCFFASRKPSILIARSGFVRLRVATGGRRGSATIRSIATRNDRSRIDRFVTGCVALSGSVMMASVTSVMTRSLTDPPTIAAISWIAPSAVSIRLRTVSSCALAAI